ncbi:MFS transporter [Fulvitalea axinellae]|uniref:MFS transporter n=1 Tax=Fulvitalea axinellae TaxID=1182444 RepID=A0AAU9CHS1_9BACT|nr:MFS transporter [Fulvitalea axinellae]
MKTLYTNYVDTFRGLSREVWWLALITFINRAGTMVVPFLSLYLTEGRGFELKQVGWIMTSFGLGSLAGSWLGGKLTDKYGFYNVMLWSLSLSALLFVGMGYLDGFYAICAGVFVLMLVADTFRPAIFVSLAAYSKPENRTRSLTLIRLAINLGFSLGPAIGGAIIAGIGYLGLFWTDGLTCLGAAGLFIWALDRRKGREKDADTTATTARSPYTDWPYLIFLLSMLLFGFVFLQYFSIIPLFYKDAYGLGEGSIGLLLSMNGLLIFILEMPLVAYFEKQKKISQVGILILGSLLMGLSFLALVVSPWVGLGIIGMMVMTLSEMLTFPFSNALAMRSAEGGQKGAYMALYSMAFSFSHIFAHNAGMRLVDAWGYDMTWWVMVACSVLSVVLLVFLKMTNQRSATKQLESVVEKAE